MASAGPVTGDLGTAVRLEEAGAGAIVLPSLFEEEILHEEWGLNGALEAGAGAFPEAHSYFPAVEAFDTTADRYFTTVRLAKKHLSVPVIASLKPQRPAGAGRDPRQRRPDAARVAPRPTGNRPRWRAPPDRRLRFGSRPSSTGMSTPCGTRSSKPSPAGHRWPRGLFVTKVPSRAGRKTLWARLGIDSDRANVEAGHREVAPWHGAGKGVPQRSG